LQTERKLKRITIDTNPEDCNLKCIMCEEHSEYSDYIKNKLLGKHRRMPEHWLEPIFVEAQSLGVEEIIPSTMGEPLLYKSFPKIVELCGKYNMKLNLTTNASFPKVNGNTPEKWAEILVPIVSDVKFSWNGASEKTAKSIMKGISFGETIRKVRKYIEIRNKYFDVTGDYSKCSFQLTFLESNMDELPEIIQLAAELDIDRVKGHHLWAHFSEIQELSFRRNSESIHRWNKIVDKAFAAQEKYTRKNGKQVILENFLYLDNQKIKVNEHYECPFLGKEIWISATGKLSPCCAPDELREELGNFGNIQNLKIKEVLDSETYKNLEKNYKSNRICENCNMRKPL
jgi:radical SAM protein with 4Fe4S-binding SPASM domain